MSAVIRVLFPILRRLKAAIARIGRGFLATLTSAQLPVISEFGDQPHGENRPTKG